LPLSLGAYNISVFISYADQEVLDFVTDAAFFEVNSGDFFGTGNPGMPNHCKILVNNTWSIEPSQIYASVVAAL
jgi:lipopolysaccharide transport system ATP-binding protein